MPEPDTHASLAAQVRDALTHLHDPGHLQRHPLTRFLQADSARASSLGRALRQDVLDAIEALHPTAGAASSGRASRAYDILRLRYVEALEMPRVMDRLSVSKSVYYAEQARAVEALTAVLSERWGLAEAGDGASRRARSSGEGRSVGPAEASDAARVASVPREAPTNLPRQLTSFVGREREIADVKRLLGTAQLLTLTGAGGCGKSRLAYRVAADLLDQYPDGAYAVELAALSDPELVPQTIASSLGVRESPGATVLLSLLDYLRTRRLLLVLDNCEHLVDACASLADSLLHSCPSVSLLATSREPLGIAGETTYRVPSLSLPDLQRLPPPDGLAGFEAVHLFAERARLVQPGFTLTEVNALAVARICNRLDGIPLAIELAATRVRALTPDLIASRLDHDFHLLTGGSRTALPRQQTLRATLDWSHNLLAETEKALLRRLSVFAGGFSLEAAEAICSGDCVEELEVVDLLTQLVDKSLVEVEDREGVARYRLLGTVRQHASGRLAESGEAEVIQRRHAQWCLELAKQAAPELDAGQESWLPILDLEQDNIRAALGWCLTRDPGMGLELGAAFWLFWWMRSRRGEGCRWLKSLIQRSDGPPAARAEALRGLALLTHDLADFSQARIHAEESLELYRVLGDSRGVGRALSILGQLIGKKGDTDGARALLEQSISLLREAADAPGLCTALYYAAYLSMEPDQSLAILEEGLEVARRAGHRTQTALFLWQLGSSLCVSGDLGRAREALEEGVGLARTLGNRWLVAWALIDLGKLATFEGEYDRAGEILEESLAELRELDDRWGQIWALNYLGQLARCLDHLTEAKGFLEECLRVAREVGRPDLLALGQVGLSQIARSEGYTDRAVLLVRESLRTVRLLVDAQMRGNCIWTAGILALDRLSCGRGTRLFAAAAARDPRTGLLYPCDRAATEAALADARSALGEEAFAQAWAEGQAMSLEQAVEYALRDDDPHSGV